MVNNFIQGATTNMKKLRIACTLLFALTCSLGLFACTQTPTETLDRITIEGQKTEFTEADTQFTTGDSFRVIGHFETDDPEKETRELTAEEITVESESMDAAFEAIAAGDYDSARGTYTITVRGRVGNEQRSTTYNVTLDHAWGEADENGVYTCPLDGAEMESHTINDNISVAAWGSTPTISENATVQMASDGSNYMTYGSISQGQSISISGTAYTTGADTWDTPVLGIRKNENLFLARQDTWVIGADGNWVGCSWTLHPSGQAAVEYTYESTEAFLEGATDWEVYYSGSSTRTDWGSQASPVNFTITWDYDKAGFVLISTTINGGTPVQRYIKVPSSTYETALYMEDVTMTVTSVSEVRNLVLDAEDGFTLEQGPDKTVYAENTMIELDADTNIVGVRAEGHYNGNSENPVDLVISTYDIYADIVTTAENEGGEPETVTTTYNLRNEQLQAGMTNFRIAFGGYELPINITVVPSSIKSVTTDHDFGAGIDNSDLIFDNAGIELVYDVNDADEISVMASGTVSRLTAEQQQALNTTKAYYVALRLVGDASETLAADGLACSIDDAVIWLANNGVNLIIPVDSAADLGEATITVPSNVTASTTVQLDLSAVTVPAVSGVVMSNNTTIDQGGDVVVNFYGVASEAELEDYDFMIGSQTRTWALLSGENGATFGSLTAKGAYADGVLTITYTLPALDIAAGSNFNLSYLVTIRNAAGESFGVTIAYNMVISEGAEDFYKVNDTTYLTYSSSALVVLTIEDDRTLAGTGALTLNLQNATGEMYDLSFTATDSGITFTTSNAATLAATTTLGLDGTIGDDTDGDRAALYITRIALSSFGLNLSDGFYVELEGTNSGTTYTLINFSNEGIATVEVEAVESDTVSMTNIPGTCLVDTLLYYTYDGFSFARQSAVTAFGQHNYVDGVCSICGTTQYGEETALNMTIGAIEGVTDTGFSISFIVEGNAADWASTAIDPLTAEGASGMVITLPNLDPYANTVGFAPTNMYPSAEGAVVYPGFAWNSFQSAVTAGTIVATITVSPTTGITYYLNGEIAIQYPVTANLTDGTSSVLSFVETSLELVEANGFLFASGAAFGTAAKELIVYPAALSEGQVAAEYAINYGDATFTQYRGISGELGTMSTLPTVWADWINVDAIQKGTSVTFYGTQVGEVESAWFTMLYEFTDNAYWTQRMDNYGWSFGTGLVKVGDGVVTMTDAEGEVVTDWVAAFQEAASDCTWTLNISFAEDGTVTATLTVNGSNGATYVNVTTWNFGTAAIPDYIGLHFTAEEAWVKVLYSVTTELPEEGTDAAE